MQKIKTSVLNDVKNGHKLDNVQLSDITLCYAIRASEITPWIIKRLKFALTYYDPMPNILIVDFGSNDPYKNEINSLCDEHNVQLAYVDDKGVFSSSKARNIAFTKTKTDFIFFADIDFIYERDIFHRLNKICNQLNLRKNPKKVITMPIFHVEKEATELFEETADLEDKDKIVAKWSFDGMGTEFGKVFDFVAPYSNSFLMHKSMFDIAGGLCDEFRGHGSEDFEFMIRLAKLSTNVPSPSNLDKDFYGPLKASFWGNKDYTGFRRYLEVLTLPSESLGLKAFHLWHDKPSKKGYWTQSNDWKRERFNSVLGQYVDHDSKLLGVDYLKRDKKALCIFSDKSQWGYFLPLRMAGYKLETLNEKNDNAIADALRSVEKFAYDRIFIFNPYMKSHAPYRGVIEVARKLGVKVTVIERGGLPNSIYFSDEVAYGDTDYKNIINILKNRTYTTQQLETTKKVIKNLRQGTNSLEKMDSYEVTWKKHTLLRHIDKKKIFIPLQLRDDMAVNYFTEGFTSYPSFEDDIVKSVSNHSDVLFIIKQHPLSKYDLSWANKFENVVIVDQNDNIHALIDISDAVSLYNSGVGLLALAHEKPLFYSGNAYYNGDSKLATRVSSLSEATSIIKDQTTSSYDINLLHKFFSWLIFEKYSWFTANDIIRDFGDRKSHGYDNISVEILSLDGNVYFSGSDLNGYEYSERSYLNWHLSINQQNKALTSKHNLIHNKEVKTNTTKILVPVKATEKITLLPKEKTAFGKVFIPFIKPLLSEKKKNKLNKNPELFFSDSKSRALRQFGKLSIK
jgi:predicted glycosyltransferase involved in capsule biosynthesis